MVGPVTLEVDYFDGRVSRPHPARLHLGSDRIRVEVLPPGVGGLECGLREVQWSERVRHGARTARFPQGQMVQALDPAAWDRALTHLPRREGWVVRVQQSWHSVLVGVVLLVAVTFALYRWGVPALARAITPMIPQEIDVAMGRDALLHLEGRLFRPSELPQEQRQRLQSRLTGVLKRMPGVPAVQLEFRKSRIGPNALALPGGVLIVTDELVKLVQDDDTVLGVIGHEIGHVQLRHGMRQLVQVTAMQAVLSVAMGDYGSFLTTAPLVIGTMGYSRDHEREADEASVRFMRAADISPAVMAGFFEKVNARRKDKNPEGSVGISILSSHPDDAERIAYFRRAAESL